MRRVMIVGPGNAGKSTLARELGGILDIPVHHLDKYFWKENWTEISPRQRNRIHQQLINQESWIIEGGWDKLKTDRIARADTIIYMDQPRHVSIYRWLKRIRKYRQTPRPDMGGNNIEKFNLVYLKLLMKHRYKSPKRQQEQNTLGSKMIVLNGTAAVNNFLAQVKHDAKRGRSS